MNLTDNDEFRPTPALLKVALQLFMTVLGALVGWMLTGDVVALFAQPGIGLGPVYVAFLVSIIGGVIGFVAAQPIYRRPESALESQQRNKKIQMAILIPLIYVIASAIWATLTV